MRWPRPRLPGGVRRAPPVPCQSAAQTAASSWRARCATQSVCHSQGKRQRSGRKATVQGCATQGLCSADRASCLVQETGRGQPAAADQHAAGALAWLAAGLQGPVAQAAQAQAALEGSEPQRRPAPASPRTMAVQDASSAAMPGRSVSRKSCCHCQHARACPAGQQSAGHAPDAEAYCAEPAVAQGKGIQVLDMGSHMLEGLGSHALLQVLVPGLEDRAREFPPLPSIVFKTGAPCPRRPCRQRLPCSGTQHASWAQPEQGTACTATSAGLTVTWAPQPTLTPRARTCPR